MACKICSYPELIPIHQSSFEGRNVRYIFHPGTGVEIVRCTKCSFMCVEFTHPRLIDLIYNEPFKPQEEKFVTLRSLLHRENCKNQFRAWKNFFSKENNRVLFLGAGRGEHAEIFCAQNNEVFVHDLVPQNLREVSANSNLVPVEIKNLIDRKFRGSFDFIILSNFLERVPFPRKHLSLCSYLLKPGGKVALEVPHISHDSVLQDQFGIEELNFFSEQSLHAMFGSNLLADDEFSLVDLHENTEPESLKGATNFGAIKIGEESTGNRNVFRAVLINNKTRENFPEPDVNPGDMLLQLQKMSAACFLHRLHLSRGGTLNSSPKGSFNQ